MRLLLVFSLLSGVASKMASISIQPELAGTSVHETRGYELRDMQLAPPYSTAAQWEFWGDALLMSSRVRLTRNEPHLSGAVWSKRAVTERDWEMQVTFRVSGPNTPADGLAIWYSAEKGLGDVFGSSANFTGIGIVVDTYSNGWDHSPMGPVFPKLSVVLGRGQETFDIEDDGKNLMLGGIEQKCRFRVVIPEVVNARDRRFSRLLVRYVREKLSIYYAEHDEEQWTLCTTYEGLHLPLNYYAGISASTGDLSSSHELLSFKMFSVDAPQHYSTPVSTPMYLGQVGYVKEEDSNSTSESPFWQVFRIAFYTGFFACFLFAAYWVYNQFAKANARNRRFY